MPHGRHGSSLKDDGGPWRDGRMAGRSAPVPGPDSGVDWLSDLVRAKSKPKAFVDPNPNFIPTRLAQIRTQPIALHNAATVSGGGGMGRGGVARWQDSVGLCGAMGVLARWFQLRLKIKHMRSSRLLFVLFLFLLFVLLCFFFFFVLFFSFVLWLLPLILNPLATPSHTQWETNTHRKDAHYRHRHRHKAPHMALGASFGSTLKKRQWDRSNGRLAAPLYLIWRVIIPSNPFEANISPR